MVLVIQEKITFENVLVQTTIVHTHYYNRPIYINSIILSNFETYNKLNFPVILSTFSSEPNKLNTVTEPLGICVCPASLTK